MLSKTKKNALDTIFIGESYRLLNKDVIESARGVIESLPDNTLEIEVEFSLKDTVYIFWNLSKYRVKGFRVRNNFILQFDESDIIDDQIYINDSVLENPITQDEIREFIDYAKLKLGSGNDNLGDPEINTTEEFLKKHATRLSKPTLEYFQKGLFLSYKFSYTHVEGFNIIGNKVQYILERGITKEELKSHHFLKDVIIK